MASQATQEKIKADKAAKKKAAATADSDSEEDSQTDLRNPDVVTKYREGGRIVDEAMKGVVGQCVNGAKIVDLCKAGDAALVAATDKIYNKKGKDKAKIEKGIGFPTCISVNNVVGHFSPLTGDETTLKDGDLVKVDMGVHIDGYLAVSAHSFVVGEKETSGRKADVLMAAYTGAELALRLLKPGNKSTQVSDMLEKVASEFNCNQVAGIVSHEMTQFVIDGEKVIVNKPEPDQKVEEVEFEPNEVYAIDIVMSTGEGKVVEADDRCCVYKRATEENYSLKMKTSKQVLSEINKRFPTFPFTIRELNEKTVRFGIVECRNHDLVTAYPVLHEKEDEFVAHLKFTALIMPNGTVKVNGLPFGPEKYKPDGALKDKDLVALMATSAGKKKKNKKKKKKKAAA